jgi:hypothetical protein
MDMRKGTSNIWFDYAEKVAIEFVNKVEISQIIILL